MIPIQKAQLSYHAKIDEAMAAKIYPPIAGLDYTFDFENFYHPMVGKLIAQLNTAQGDPIEALLDPTFLAQTKDFFRDEYHLAADSPIDVSYHPKAVEFGHQQPYANYNWELAYHIPIAVAVHLSRNQRFAEAQKWFHYVFDPTSKDDVDAPARFWKFAYFRSNPYSIDLARLIELMSATPGSVSDPDARHVADLATAYTNSVKHPFMPFAVARPRTVSFQYYVVMAYLDNLIAWGDSLFSQMTIETVNEATLCYVLASNLLGPKPQQVPALGSTGAMSYNQLKAHVDAMGDALVALEGQFPFNMTGSASTSTNSSGSLFGIGRTLYFCIPPNAKLLGYWDTVADRLYKIRHCENIHGQVQLMPLFDPPIDPGMLVAAAAAGLDLSSVINGLNQPISPVRCQVLIQKALELCAEVKALGAGLLAAIEKGDAEQLAQLRQTNEIAVQRMVENLRYVQWQQTKAATEALLRTRATALERYTYYLRLLGQEPDTGAVPPTFSIDHEQALSVDDFESLYGDLVAKYDLTINPIRYPRLQLAEGSSPASSSGASGTGQLYLSSNEDAELNSHMPNARDSRLAASIADTVAATVEMIPSLNVDLHFWGLGVHSDVFSGVKLSAIARIGADVLRTLAGWESDQGAMAARTAGYQRRADDWMLQANLAARELSQLGRQLIASLLTEQAAAQEYRSAKEQVGQAQDVLTLMQSKFTNAELYGWMQGQLSTLYHQYYQFALDTARKAEATMKWELMRPELDSTSYIQPNYWDGGRRGLLTGESLYLDVKRMELDYLNYDVRELELTRHISLRQLDPLALLTLKMTGTCTLRAPEWLFDRDCPGHYLRRIKTVSVSIPSVVGPYTTVNCTLSLQSSSVRVDANSAVDYARKPDGDDPRFVDYYGTLQSIVTSGAVLDSGMFETNLRDERFLPFEGAGVISTWSLSLPKTAAFDYSTISDVVLHIRYTARDGGQALAAKVATELQHLPPAGAGAGAQPQLPLLLSLRHDFPAEWYSFVTGTGDFSAQLTLNFLPYAVQNAQLTFAPQMIVYVDHNGHPVPTTIPTPANLNHLSQGPVTLTVPHADLTRDETAEYYLLLTYSART